ncbi:hypothetical protein LTR36_001292 [Oleoguttula mirabilis]|uniref:Uncharacterized protein n=1 Tax=Oleoguttula mirabilis TaxID=1507867 RepID=A0AAV9JQ11_9PEZI|nr:hypothetical protein LTR36_001292 [Oleoguttula mirabilis]
MGCNSSKPSPPRCPTRESLRSWLPPVTYKITNEYGAKSIVWGFLSNREREDFIAAVMLVMSDNGQRSLQGFTIALHYPLAEQAGFHNQYHAALAATEGGAGGAVRYSFVSGQTGATRQAAFAQLRMDVEQCLGRLLLGKPTYGAAAEGGRVVRLERGEGAGAETPPPPPPYTGGVK